MTQVDAGLLALVEGAMEEWENDQEAPGTESCAQHIVAALRASPPPEAGVREDIEKWIEREFAGHGRAIRRKDEPPFPDEPYMSMADAKELARRAFALSSPLPTAGREDAIELPEFLGSYSHDDPRKVVAMFREALTAEHHAEIAMRLLTPSPPVSEASLSFICPKCGTRGITDGKSITDNPNPAEPLDPPAVWLDGALRNLARELLADPKTPWIGERDPTQHICWTAADRLAALAKSFDNTEQASGPTASGKPHAS